MFVQLFKDTMTATLQTVQLVETEQVNVVNTEKEQKRWINRLFSRYV